MKSDAFADFFRAIHGQDRDPFPWQERLARLVCEKGQWPGVIDLPTGSGKTACIDIAIFHLLVAAASGRPSAASRRIAFVVDRRIIVDEAAVRARHISDAIEAAKDGILAQAASVLEAISGERKIEVFTLRGGVPREKNLVRDPRNVAVVLSTVDQIGSRLLFRGYGVSDNAKPMHAGMFGFDTLVLLDEAHIAEPFRQTLAGIRREQARASDSGLGVRPLQWAQLSATPSGESDFKLDDEDRRHPVLKKRLDAQKPMRLLEVSKRDDLPKKLLELVKAELGAPALSSEEKPRVGIVVNRVASAREVHASLRRALEGVADVHLVMGRIRPLDRDQLMEELGRLLKAGARPPGDRPIVVVATQTIEVGADFDFHAMFIEAASYPAIRQRLGRLNRLGERAASRGAIVFVKSGSDKDPVYGETIATTWSLLENVASNGIVDLGIQRAPAATSDTMPQNPRTPELSPSLVQLLAQTSPRPALEPDVAQFLHGLVEQRPDISVVWREGLLDKEGEIDVDVAKAVLEDLPPLAAEAASLPLSGFRAWARSWAGKSAKGAAMSADAGDIEGDTAEDDDDSGAGDAKVLVMQDEEIHLLAASQVRPGSVVVVPSERGGNDAYGFAPDSKEHVRDLSLLARKSRRAAIAVTPRLAELWATDPSESTALTTSVRHVLKRISNEELERAELREVFFDWLDAFADTVRDDVRSVLTELRSQRAIEIEPIVGADGDALGFVVRATRAKSDDLVDDRYGLQRTVDVPLDEHLAGVAAYAKRFAQGLGLPSEIIEALQLAGHYHDLGKADPRFQSMLGADEGRLLAKGRAVDRRVVLGARHECYSVALLDRHPKLLEQTKLAGLIKYLVGSHHGRGRGLQPIVEDGGTAFALPFEGNTLEFQGRADLSSLSSGWCELFGLLQNQYGAWGLAYLETVLRLADHRRSEDELKEKTR